MDIFSILYNMKKCCMFSLESPHRGDSNEYIQYTILYTSKRAISVRATEVPTIQTKFPSLPGQSATPWHRRRQLVATMFFFALQWRNISKRRN